MTSDLWSSASGTAFFQWYQWDGTLITNVSIPVVSFIVGALNTTLVYATTIDNSTLDYNNAILHMNISARGRLPNTNTTTMFTHENFFHADSLANARLVDPRLRLTYDSSVQMFTIEATSGVAVWTWIDYPAGALLNFDRNGFLLLPGHPKKVGYTLKSDTTNGSWVEQVTVESLWNNTLAY